MAVDPTHVSFVQRNAVAIKEIENLDRNFSAVIEAIAELSRREYASRRISRHVGSDRHHFVDGLT